MLFQDEKSNIVRPKVGLPYESLSKRPNKTH